MDSEAKYRKVYHALLQRCSQIENFNERLSYRLLQSRRVLLRLRQQRQFLVKRLDEHHDNYDNIDVLLQERKKRIEKILGHSGDLFDVTDGISSEEETKGKVKKGHYNLGDPMNGKMLAKKFKIKGYAKQEKERDPNAPKKPANAFFHFCQEKRNLPQDVQKEEADSSGYHDLTKFLSNKWNSLPSADKKVYYEMYERDKKRYEEELKIYNNKKADGEAAKTLTPSEDTKENIVNEIEVKEEETTNDPDESKAEFESLSNEDQDSKMEVEVDDDSEHINNGDDNNNLDDDSEDDFKTTTDVNNDYQEFADTECDVDREQLDSNCDSAEDEDQDDLENSID